LANTAARGYVRESVKFAELIGTKKLIAGLRKVSAPDSKKKKKRGKKDAEKQQAQMIAFPAAVANRSGDLYWQSLEAPFKQLVLDLGKAAEGLERVRLCAAWKLFCVDTALSVFGDAAAPSLCRKSPYVLEHLSTVRTALLKEKKKLTIDTKTKSASKKRAEPREKDNSPEAVFLRKLMAIYFSGDRGRLAAVRRASEGNVWGALPVLMPLMPDDYTDEQRDLYVWVAGHYATCPDTYTGYGNMGRTFHGLVSDWKKPDDAMKKSFSAVLEQDLPTALDSLHRIIRLAASRCVQINWIQLLKDVQHWSDKGEPVQWEWVDEFWTPSKRRK